MDTNYGVSYYCSMKENFLIKRYSDWPNTLYNRIRSGGVHKMESDFWKQNIH